MVRDAAADKAASEPKLQLTPREYTPNDHLAH